MGRSLTDVAVLADVLKGHDPADQATYARAKPDMLAGSAAEPPVDPIFAWFDMPYHDQLSDAMRDGLDEVLETLGDHVERLPAPKSFSDVIQNHRTIHEYEFRVNLESDPATSPENIQETLAPVLARAKNISEQSYREALEMVTAAEQYFSEFFNDYDAHHWSICPG